MTAAGGPSLLPLAAFLLFYIAERSAELVLSARHVRRLLARGGRESIQPPQPAEGASPQ